MKTCQECRWFDRNDTKVGICRLQPPIVIPVQVEGEDRNGRSQHTKPFTAWPLVRNNDWCADWEARPIGGE